MACMRCGTCHKLMTRPQALDCLRANHEPPYDDEEGEP